MESVSIELKDKDSKGGNLIQSSGDFDESELKKRKMIRIIVIVSIILVIAIVALVLFLCLRPNYNKCEKGENDKCSTCQKNSKDCATCNTYFRLKNGKCFFIYSFEAKYKTSSTNDINGEIKLFNVDSLKDYKINKIQVDDKYVRNTTNYYNFDTDEEHIVRINIDLNESSSLQNFFGGINELISINFTNDFNTIKITNMDGMFSSSKNLVYIDISNLNLENNKDMSSMFNQCISLKDINFTEINTKNVLNTSNMFNGCTSLESIDLTYLNTENVIDMSNMFTNSGKLSETDFSKLKTDNVENMFGMFENSGVTSLDLSNFNTTKTTNMGNMFKNCKFLNSLKLNFDTENVENMSGMFSFCKGLNSLNITMFDTRNCTNFSGIFEDILNMDLYIDSIKCRNLIEEIPETFSIQNYPSIPVIGEIKCSYQLDNIHTQILGEEFNKTSEFDIYLNGKFIKYSKKIKRVNIESATIEFKLYEDLNMDYMFKDLQYLTYIEMKSENDCQILSMISTFENAKSLERFTINGFSTEQIKSMSKLFYNSDLSDYTFNIDNTNNLEDISYMFSGTNIYYFSLDGFNTINVKNMSHIFENCSSLLTFNDEGIKTNNVKDMSCMFKNCYSITSMNILNFDTKEVENMASMFENCNSLTSVNLKNFDTSKVKDMNYMFAFDYSVSILDVSNFITHIE